VAAFRVGDLARIKENTTDAPAARAYVTPFGCGSRPLHDLHLVADHGCFGGSRDASLSGVTGSPSAASNYTMNSQMAPCNRRGGRQSETDMEIVMRNKLLTTTGTGVLATVLAAVLGSWAAAGRAADLPGVDFGRVQWNEQTSTAGESKGNTGNQFGAFGSPSATVGFNLGGVGGLSLGREESYADIRAVFTAEGNGKSGRLFITATIKPGWYIYQYSKTRPKTGPRPTEIFVDSSADFELSGDFQAYPPAKRKRDPGFQVMVDYHEGTVTWHAPLRLAEGVDPARLSITGTVKYQACDPNNCVLQEAKFVARLGQAPELPAAALQTPSAETSGGAVFDPQKLRATVDRQLASSTLWIELGLGFLGGILLNLMPCVLPVIGLKILSFVEQAGKDRVQALMLNIWYSAGLISVFLLLATLAVFLQLGWGELFAYAGFNVAIASVIFAMGLSFLGVWEIPIPGFIGSGKAVELGQREGLAGAFAKGVITTVLATPCTGPFMGSALAWAVNQPPWKTYAVFGSVGLGMASPYLLIGAFPSLIRFLPKPGQWMETFKHLMGFVLLGTVVYILTFMQPAYVVPTVGLLFAIWAACWWVGRIPVTANTVTTLRGWAEAIAFVGLMWIVLFPGIDKILPGRFAFGGLYEVMQYRLAEHSGMASSAPGAGDQSEERAASYLDWQPFTTRRALEELLNSNKTVMIDFTADWCPTCKVLERLYLNNSDTKRVIEELGIVAMKADWTHKEKSVEVTEMLNLLGARSVPTLAIFPAGRPNEPIVFRGGFTHQQLLDALRKAAGSGQFSGKPQ